MEKGGEGQEIDDLAEAFNTMSGNTKKLFDELRVVTDDIAHDLKTPLTRIHGMAEITVRGPRDWEIYQDTLGNIAEECDHMVSMINSMLEITRTESAIDQPLKDEVDFADMLRQAFEIYQMSALDHEVTMTAKIPAEAAPLHANKVKLQRVVSNLLDNALKFTPAGGKIEISLTRGADWYCFDVADNGPGIADENKARIFERFFRCDSSRTLPGNAWA